MKVKLLCVGKIKHRAMEALAEEYARRIRHFHKFELIEIPDETIRAKPDISSVLAREAKSIEKFLKTDAHLIVLEEKGAQWTSVELAWELGQLFNSTVGEIVFLIGGAYGVSPQLLEKAKVRFSLSKLTLPHQLARVLCLEQIYRALTILKNVPYHHE